MILPISFKDNWRLKRLHRNLEKIKSKNDDLIFKEREKLKESGNSAREIHQKLESLRQDQYIEYLFIREEISSHITNSLRRESKKLLISMPASFQDEEIWELTQTTSDNILTEKGVSLLKEAIRKERAEISKDKKQRRDSWLPWIAAVSGLIGVITGLLAVLSSLYK